MVAAVLSVVPEAAVGEKPGLLALRAAVAASVASLFTGDEYRLAAGGLWIRYPKTSWLFRRKRIIVKMVQARHVWATSAIGDRPGMILDLSTQLHLSWAEAAGLSCPPNLLSSMYVWKTADNMPFALNYVPDAEATLAAREAFWAGIESGAFSELVAAAVKHVEARIRRGF